MLLIPCENGEQLIAYVLGQLGLTGREHDAEAPLGVEAGRIALAELAPERDLPRVDVRQRHRHERPVRIDEVDRAPVGDLRDGESGHLLEGLLEVERGGKRLGGLGEDPLGALRLLDLGHVLAHVDRARDVALLILQRSGLDPDPARAPSLRVDAAHQEGRWRLAPNHPPPRQLGQVDRPPVLVVHGEALGPSARRRREYLLDALPSHERRRGLVDVDELAARVVNRHRVGEIVERQPQERRAQLPVGDHRGRLGMRLIQSPTSLGLPAPPRTPRVVYSMILAHASIAARLARWPRALGPRPRPPPVWALRRGSARCTSS